MQKNLMMKSIKNLHGMRLEASDGGIGHVKDFYFDDQSWVIRYVVADTGIWLPGRKVLISPLAFGSLHQNGNAVLVNLTRKQIEESPAIETHKPISRQYEEEFYQYFGWPHYWQGGELWGMNSFPIVELPANSSHDQPPAKSGPQIALADAHLRSTTAVNGYHLRAGEATIGHVCDFIMDVRSWAICLLVAKTGHRLTGNEVEIPTNKVDRISYDDSTIHLNLTKEDVEQSPKHLATPVGAAD
jgi:hypothetical protein